MQKQISEHSRPWLRVLIGVVSLCAAMILFREQWLLPIGNFLIIEDQLHPVDVILVIAGEDYRTNYAIELYKQGYGRTLFFTGGWCKEHQFFHGEHGRTLAVEAGVSFDRIVIDDSEVLSTYMEAKLLKEWIVQSPYPIQSVIVVSDPFHMRRARWTYRKVLGNNIEIQMAPVPFEQTPFQRTWWRDHTSRTAVREEYGKLLYYLARYQYSWGYARDWLATWDQE